MEGDGADGRSEHPMPRQSYTKQYEANQAARGGGPAQTSRAGEPSAIWRRGGQAAQSPPKWKHMAYSKCSGRLLKKITSKPAKYQQLFR